MAKILKDSTAAALMDLINQSGVRGAKQPGAPRDQGGAAAVVKKSFTVTITGKIASILAGTIRTAWGNFAVAANSSLTLSGSVAWIFVQASKADLSTNSITFSNDEPINTGANWQLTLAKATSSDGGTTYSIANGDVRHDGDFTFISPINKP